MNISEWMSQAVHALKAQFGDNLVFVGLQGSYRRGTATPESDIDIAVIFREMDMSTLHAYRTTLDSLPHGQHAHGFTATLEDLFHWPRHELPGFFADTHAYYGTLEDVLPSLDHEDIVTGARASAATVYHMLVHSIVAGETPDMEFLNKQAYFTSVLHGAAVRGTFNWAQPRPHMTAEQMLAWLSTLLEEL